MNRRIALLGTVILCVGCLVVIGVAPGHRSLTAESRTSNFQQNRYFSHHAWISTGESGTDLIRDSRRTTTTQGEISGHLNATSTLKRPERRISDNRYPDAALDLTKPESNATLSQTPRLGVTRPGRGARAAFVPGPAVGFAAGPRWLSPPEAPSSDG